MSVIADGLLDAAVDEIVAALVACDKRRPGEVAIAEYSQRMAISYSVARRQLEQGVRDGKLTRRSILESGHCKTVYMLCAAKK